MCRMLIAFGNVNADKLLNGIISMAKDETIAHEFNKNRTESFQHPDGWGIAYLDSNKEWVIEKSTKAIFEDPKINDFRNLKTNLMIIHARKGTKGTISLLNTHPFHVNDQELGEFVFCHNGHVKNKIKFSSKFIPQGETDSEEIFYSILTKMQASSTTESIRKTLLENNQCKGTNVILSSKEKTFVSIRENIRGVYYQMSLGRNQGSMIISSEELNSFPKASWKPIKPGEVIVIDHNTMEISKI